MKSHISIVLPVDDTKKVYFDYNGFSFRTNDEGYGLWLYNSYHGEYNQVLGTCQFHLTQKYRASMRNYIKDHIHISPEGNLSYSTDGGL